MVYVLRIVALSSLVACVITVFHPRSGWGRLGFFIPKLFAGSRIVHLSVVGFAAAVAGWLSFGDPVSLVLGLGATALGSRHVARLFCRSLQVASRIPLSTGAQRMSTRAMLPRPWVVVWRQPDGTRQEKDVAIGRNPETGDPILVDLSSPPSAIEPSGLGILYLHGSGWHYGDKDFGTRPFFKQLTSQGHVVIDVAYSLAPMVDLFGMVGDIKRAIVWTKQHARELHISENQIVLMGGSAGGHLALLAAYTPDHPRLDPPGIAEGTSVCGVVSYYGPPDLRAQFDRFRELPSLDGKSRFERAFMRYLEARFGFQVIPIHSLLTSLMGGTPTEVSWIYDLASPLKHVSPDLPPTLLLQGVHDFSGVAPEVLRLHETLLQAGAISYLLELPDTEHGFDLYKPNWSPAAQAATYVTERFLASLAGSFAHGEAG